MLITEKIEAGREVKGFSLTPSFEGGILNIEISGGCNEDCIYCTYAAVGAHKGRKLIDEELFYRVTKEAYELGVTDVALYIGGEPFMNPKIYDYVEYLKKHLGFRYVYISTNGILCTPKNLERIVESGIDSIKFSVAAASRKNFIKHHGRDAFDLVKNNIEYAYRYRKENNLHYKLFVYLLITNFNISEKEEMMKIYKPYADEVVFLEVYDAIIKMKGLSEYLTPNKKDSSIPQIKNTLPCGQLINRINIDENGFLRPCCSARLYDISKIADLNHMTLSQAVYGEDMTNLRKRHMENDIGNTICNRCINGIIETMNPLSDRYGFEPLDIEFEEREEEIKKRFF